MNPNLPTGETFSEGSDIAPQSATPEAGPLTVPLAFLAQPDDSEQMQTPAKGDSGTMQVGYTVTDIVGDNAIIQPTAINGNDLESAEEETENPNAADEQEGQDLQKMAMQMGQ